MPGSDLYRKYRQRIEQLADEQRPTDLSLTALCALLQQFENEAAGLRPRTAHFVSDEIADQLEHEALRSTSRHRRDVLLAAVKVLESMVFSGSKP
jgi:hypothetical protein